MSYSINWNDEADKRLAVLATATERAALHAQRLAAAKATGLRVHPTLDRRARSSEIVRAAAERAYLNAADRAVAQFGRVSA